MSELAWAAGLRGWLLYSLFKNYRNQNGTEHFRRVILGHFDQLCRSLPASFPKVGIGGDLIVGLQDDLK